LRVIVAINLSGTVGIPTPVVPDFPCDLVAIGDEIRRYGCSGCRSGRGVCDKKLSLRSLNFQVWKTGGQYYDTGLWSNLPHKFLLPLWSLASSYSVYTATKVLLYPKQNALMGVVDAAKQMISALV
jgi:hypothetical protein